MLKTMLVAALLAAAVPCRAASNYYGEAYRVGKWNFGLTPGWSFPVGNTKDIMGTSWTLDTHGGYQFEEWAEAGMDWQFHFKHKVHGTTRGEYGGDFNGDGSMDLAPFNSTIHYVFMNFTPYLKLGPWLEAFNYHWRPYGVIGGGWYHEWTNSGTVTVLGNDRVSGKPDGPVIYRRDTSSNAYLGVNVGTGFDVQIDENASVGVDLRYERVFRPIFDWEFVTPTLRVIYLF